MSNTVSTKKSNTIFLAAVLIVGTFAAISPSFIIGVNAQHYAQYGMDIGYNSYDDRKSYGMDDSYGVSDYRDDKKKYDSYGASDYGMDNDRKSYDNSYKSQYQSYKPDYKPVKDDKRDKSKDSKVDINKLKCINTNLNINGENAGNVSIGNKGAAADGGYVGGGYSSVDGSEGYGSGDGYYNDGYNKNKKDNGFDCIINNNNTNNNIVAADGGGNATLAVTKTVTCIPNDNFGPAAEACQFILSNAPPSSFNIVITGNNPNPPEFLGSSVPVVVTLGAGDYEITEEVPIVSFPDGASITLTTNFAGDCRDVNPNNPQSTEATGTIQAGESQICDISNDYRTATLP